MAGPPSTLGFLAALVGAAVIIVVLTGFWSVVYAVAPWLLVAVGIAAAFGVLVGVIGAAVYGVVELVGRLKDDD